MNARAGRPPKPTHLKVIEGNPGKRPLAQPPKPSPEKPRCPSYLSPYAKTVWRRLVPLLDDMGILTTQDRETMAAFCQAVADFRRAVEVINEKGYMVQGRRKGEAVKNPMLQVKREAVREIATFSAMFGLSPADRVRLVGDAGAAGDQGRGTGVEAWLA